jgi:hypothetical protein
MRASSPVFMFCAPGHVFLWCRVRQVSFSYFVRPDSFSTDPRATGSVFLFCGAECVGSRFHVLRSGTRFRRKRGYHWHRVLFLSFALPNSFLAVPRSSGPVVMFCAPGHVFGSLDGDGSVFQVLLALTRFLRYRGHQVPFSSFAFPDSFFAVPRASGLVFKFCAT